MLTLACFLFPLLQAGNTLGDCGCGLSSKSTKYQRRNRACFSRTFKDVIRHPVTDRMSLIPGGTYEIGAKIPIIPADGESQTSVTVPDFYLDQFEVTNEDFSKFVSFTGYVTDAEAFGDTFVFFGLVEDEKDLKKENSVAATPWWISVKGARWDKPYGGKSEGVWNHPVVHVSWLDASTYCQWMGKRLPMEAEWEIGCRGGFTNKLFPWGDKLKVKGKHRANIWQGKFPNNNTAEDGFVGTAPVHQYQPNSYGLYNMVGNVWEWTSDTWSRNRDGNDLEEEEIPGNKVKKGGSYLCHKSYCYRYRCAARTPNTADTTASNVGFRCAATRKNLLYRQLPSV